MSFTTHSKRPRLFLLSLMLTATVSLLNSCVSRKEIEYFQSPEDSVKQSFTIPPEFEPLIQTSDLLEIRVTSINPDAARFFNPGTAEAGTTANEGTEYLVDRNGNIEVPLVGTIKAAGYTTTAIRDTLRSRLEKYLQSPTVNVHFKNFKITILGEVKIPGVYIVNNEKATLPEVLGLAGDLTIYGDRKQVMVVREINGKKEFGTLDLTTREVFASPYYYLRPNDLVYIAPGKGRIASSDTFYRIAPLVISFLTLLTLIGVRFDVAN